MSKIDLTTIKNGIVCFTFDDRNFEGWLNAIPIFEKYNAHASFFITGEINDDAFKTMTALKDKGHTVGLHTLNHVDAPQYFDAYGGEAYINNEIEPQLKECELNGFEIKSFGYPNNRRNQDTDEALGKYFRRFRAGIEDAPEEQVYVPINNLHKNNVMRGMGIGEYYSTVETELLEKIKYAAQTNTCVTFFSHNIERQATHIHMPTELLEKCLETANKLGIMLLGFDEI